MGNYIGATHVETFNPVRAPFGPATRPSAEQVEELIIESEVEVDSMLEQAGYAVPIASSATGAFRLVQGACARCAAAKVEMVAPAADPARIKHYNEMCESAKAALLAGVLPGVDKDTSGSGAIGSGFGAYASPMFSRDMDL